MLCMRVKFQKCLLFWFNHNYKNFMKISKPKYISFEIKSVKYLSHCPKLQVWDVGKLFKNIYFRLFKMKKLLFFLLLSIGLNAQFNYQAIVKDSNGNVLTNSQVKFKFTLMEVTSTSTPVYVEEHTVTTPADGVVNLAIGGGTASSGNFSDIDWSLAVFIKEELDLGGAYQDMGTRQFASVPVAEYAKNTRGIGFQNQALFIDELIASSVSITSLSVSNTIEVGNGIISGGTVTATSFAGYGSSLLWSQGSTQTLSEKIDDLAQLIIGNNVSFWSIPSNGLIAFFPFDGNVNDVSGNNNHGTVFGATLTTDQNGNTESAYEFNGASSIDLGNSDSLNPSNSISFYSDFLISQSFSNNYILGRNPDSSSDYGYNFGIVGDDNTQSLRFGLGNNSSGSNINDISANVDLNKNQWYSLAVTYDGTQVKFYLNGSLVSTENLTLQDGIHQNDYNTFIGKYRPNGGSNGLQFFKGKLDNVGIWNRALTHQEIQNLYFKENNVFEDASRNIALGESALSAISSGTDNLAIGNEALSKNVTGTYNVAVGIDALRNNTASRNTALGSLALRNNTTGTINTAVGFYSLVHNETGGRNVGLGDGSLYYNEDGSYNVALGNLALTKNVSGNSNVSIGDASLYNSISSNNVAIGDGAGYDLNTENSNDNTFLGNNANTVSGTQINNATSIGANAIVTTSNTIQLGDSNVTLVNTSAQINAFDFLINGISIDNKIDSIESTIASEVDSVSEITALLEIVSDLESLVDSLDKQLVAIQSSLDNLTEISFETFIDLETKTLDYSSDGPSDSSFDMKFAYNSNDSSTAARIFWNESSADMALVYDIPYDEIKITDLSNYYFCEHLNDSNSSCENTDTPPTDFVGVIETYEGNYYAIKFISETTSDVIFKYRKL